MSEPDVDAFAERYGLDEDARRELALLLRSRRTADDGRTVGWDDPVDPPPAPASDRVAGRYEELGELGEGGMGEVRRVLDHVLGRTAAMKLLAQRAAGNPAAVARFTEETRIAAQLQHPAIAPVYDAGRLPDGRPWFTMKEVRGRTLSSVIQEVHAASTDGAWGTSPSGWTLHRLVAAFCAVCEAVGYAHARGVVHRDLKPANVMVGAHGEVLVLDWGLAKIVARAEDTTDGGLDPSHGDEGPVTSSRLDRTRAGVVAGTPAYMAPEQARGRPVDARADVYALGAVLYEILCGTPPYTGEQVLLQLLSGPPAPPAARSGGPALPDELVALCSGAMARDPETRPAAPDLAAAAQRWIEGAFKRARARELVRTAERLALDASALRTDAATHRAVARELLRDLPPAAPEVDKAPGWSEEDLANRLLVDADALDTRAETELHGALTHAPDLAEAHAALAARYRADHAAAEEARDAQRARQAEARLAVHLDALPAAHPERAIGVRWLRGDGALTLQTEPDGALVVLYRLELVRRRLVAVGRRSLGRTPLTAVSLPMGSYLCEVHAEGRPSVRYPVHVGRGEHWDGVPPGAHAPVVLRLPSPGELDDGECYVPAGWFRAGDPNPMGDSMTRRRVWCDAFVIGRFPVTHREYLRFVNALVDARRDEEASRYVPRAHPGGADEVGACVYVQDAHGRFQLPEPAGDQVRHLLDQPVVQIDWHSAAAYARWLALTTGKGWRLPAELEWEKAARGVDGRRFPWGDFFDPSWCCVRHTHVGVPAPAVVDSFPVDESVYGVRGCAGNVQDWCIDVFHKAGPRIEDDRVVLVPAADADPGWRTRRGGYWAGYVGGANCAYRNPVDPASSGAELGFRLARPLPGPDGPPPAADE